MKRRHFIKTIGAAVAFPTLIPASALGRDGFVAPSNRIAMGSIGLGGQGSGNTRNFLGDKRVQLVALCDVCKRSNRYGYGHNNTCGAEVFKEQNRLDVPIYNDFRELIARPDIDAVTTATPDHWHAIIDIACANAGKDVHGEKPLTRTVTEGRYLCDAVRRNGIIWQTGSWQRSVREFWYACELVRNGAIGKVKLIKIGLPSNAEVPPLKPEPIPEELDWDMWLGPAQYADYHPFRAFTTWRFFSDYSAGKIADWGAHHLDIAHWAMGYDLSGPVKIEPIEVPLDKNGNKPKLWQKDGFYDLSMNFNVRFTYERGEVVEMSNRHKMGLEIIGEDGTIWVDRGRLASSPSNIVDIKISPTEDTRLYGLENPNHIGAFIDSVLNRRLAVTDIETAHRTNTGCLLAEIAYTTGRTINWDYKNEKIIGDEQASRMLSRAYRGNWQLV